MRRLGWLVLMLACAAPPLATAPAAAQSSPPVAAAEAPPLGPEARLDAARNRLQAVQKRLAADATTDQLQALRDEVLALQPEAAELAEELAPALARVEARLGELGPPPKEGTEPADIARERRSLENSRTELGAQLKLAGLLGVEAEQALETLSEQRRTHFEAELFGRTRSVLAPPFWRELAQGLTRDRPRVVALGAELADLARAAPAAAWVGWALAVAAAVVLRRWLHTLLLRWVTDRAPAGRLRRSALATGSTLLALLVPLVAAHGLRAVLLSEGTPTPALQALLITAVGAVVFGAYLSGLGRALLAARRPSWRLPRVPDAVAFGLRRLPARLALVLVLGWLADRLATSVNASLATLVAFNGVFALAVTLLIVQAMRRSHRLARQAGADAALPSDSRPLWASALLIAGSVLVAFSLVCLLSGYVALGTFIVRQVVWIALVLATTYLLCVLVDDVCMAWVARPAAEDGRDVEAGAPPALLRDSLAVLVSGVLRLSLALFALVLIAAPFGQGPSELLARTSALQEGLLVGEIRLAPATVLQAVLVLGLGLLGVRGLQRWLEQRFLPTTRLDAGMRASATSLLGAVGVVFAVALALSAVGLGLERIAWVASALSVGIGFGMQAVVSNFVSGLILLAERPVKVGDWVSLGTGVEGDIRRINVRATEIQMGDRSTVIVPNSEFITKTVRNITHADPIGLVQLKLPLPLDVPADRVRDELMAALTGHESVLGTPAPTVRLEGVEVDKLVFAATGFVASPRQAASVRSDVLFDALRRLRSIGVVGAATPPAAGTPP
jgi:small-conductance mechanosensitive channel